MRVAEPVSAAPVVEAALRREEVFRSQSFLLAARYPAYNWAHNCGYSTLDHRNAIFEVGLTPHHRRSFDFNAQLELL